MCDMTHAYVRRDVFIFVTRLIYMCDMTHAYVRHDFFICSTRLIHMCNMTHSHVRYDSFIFVTWLIHMCNMTHSYVRHDTFVRVTRECVRLCHFNTNKYVCVHSREWIYKCIYAKHICATRLIRACDTWMYSFVSFQHKVSRVRSFAWMSLQVHICSAHMLSTFTCMNQKYNSREWMHNSRE